VRKLSSLALPHQDRADILAGHAKFSQRRYGARAGRRKHLGKLLSRSNKAMRNGIQLSAATGAAIFRHAYWMGLEGIYWQDEHGHRNQNAKTKSAHTISP
jgi:hypothetical protein